MDNRVWPTSRCASADLKEHKPKSDEKPSTYANSPSTLEADDIQ